MTPQAALQESAMRTDICAREDTETQAALLEALGEVGAMPEGDGGAEVPLPVGLLRFVSPGGVLTVFTDAWGVDLEGPDELVQQVLQVMATPD
jgi:hypothetical protein